MKHSRVNVLMRLSLMVLLVVLLLMSVSCMCDLGLSLEVENRTDQTLTIYVNDVRTFDVEAGKTVKRGTVIITTDHFIIKARNAEGKIFYSRDYTLNQLDAMHYKITILPPSE